MFNKGTFVDGRVKKKKGTKKKSGKKKKKKAKQQETTMEKLAKANDQLNESFSRRSQLEVSFPPTYSFFQTFF